MALKARKRPPYAYKGEPQGTAAVAAYLNGDFDCELGGVFKGERTGVKPTAAELEEIRSLLRTLAAIDSGEKYPLPLEDRAGLDDRQAWLAEVSAVLGAHPPERRTHPEEHGRIRTAVAYKSFHDWILHLIVNFAEQGLAGRFRECSQCGRVFYGHRDDQWCCSKPRTLPERVFEVEGQRTQE